MSPDEKLTLPQLQEMMNHIEKRLKEHEEEVAIMKAMSEKIRNHANWKAT